MACDSEVGNLAGVLVGRDINGDLLPLAKTGTCEACVQPIENPRLASIWESLT